LGQYAGRNKKDMVNYGPRIRLSQANVLDAREKVKERRNIHLLRQVQKTRKQKDAKSGVILWQVRRQIIHNLIKLVGNLDQSKSRFHLLAIQKMKPTSELVHLLEDVFFPVGTAAQMDDTVDRARCDVFVGESAKTDELVDPFRRGQFIRGVSHDPWGCGGGRDLRCALVVRGTSPWHGVKGRLGIETAIRGDVFISSGAHNCLPLSFQNFL
jgi:hypothetical protein